MSALFLIKLNKSTSFQFLVTQQQFCHKLKLYMQAQCLRLTFSENNKKTVKTEMNMNKKAKWKCIFMPMWKTCGNLFFDVVQHFKRVGIGKERKEHMKDFDAHQKQEG